MTNRYDFNKQYGYFLRKTQKQILRNAKRKNEIASYTTVCPIPAAPNSKPLAQSKSQVKINFTTTSLLHWKM